jgi:2-oxoglutarate dehydrogenase E1 component
VQFGDFANNAQMIIDNFIASGEAKWGCASALVLLLPHGYDGQGPEHSSARLERFLQLVDGDADALPRRPPNLLVAQPSTPAQYFHLLRRQIHSPQLKPLVVAAPKWLLHHRPCVSSLEDFAPGTAFAPLIVDGADEDNLRGTDASIWGAVPAAQVERVALCSGSLYYKLAHMRRARRDGKIALARLEQLAPFPHEAVARLAAAYPNAEITWVQEMPKNMGPWSWLQPRFRAAVRAHGLERHGTFDHALDATDLATKCVDASHGTLRLLPALHYIGRPAAASPATGSFRIHLAEQKALLDAVFETPKRDRHATRRPRVADEEDEEDEAVHIGYARLF